MDKLEKLISVRSAKVAKIKENIAKLREQGVSADEIELTPGNSAARLQEYQDIVDYLVELRTLKNAGKGVMNNDNKGKW